MPFDHVTLGCEAFALALDDAAEVYGPMRGERMPFGLDVEWETDGAVYRYPPGHPSGARRYELPCRVHGDVLVGDERIELDAFGQRYHTWGIEDWWGLAWTSVSGRLGDGTRFHGTAIEHGDDPASYAPGYMQAPGGAQTDTAHGVEGVEATARSDEAGFPVSASVTIGDLRLDVYPVAFASVLVEAPDGRRCRLVRALCRYHDPANGRWGTGWTETTLT